MPWYRSREFRAVQWTGDNVDEITGFLGQKPTQVRQGKAVELRFFNGAIEGTSGVMPGDYVIEGTWPDGSHWYAAVRCSEFEENNSLVRPS